MEPPTGSPASPPRQIKYARELTTLVVAPLAIWIVGWAPLAVYDAAIAVIASLALYEFLVLGRTKGFHLPITLCILVMLFIIAAFILEPISVEMGVFLALLVIPAAYVFAPWGDLEEALPSSGIAVLATLYVGMLGGSLIRLRTDFGPIGAKLVYFLLLVVWCGDAGAYYVGTKLGKTKLSPRISPKKTVAGLVGGIGASIITGLAVRFTFFPEFPLLHAVIASIILSMAGVIGDLAESMWKRSAAVKDSGSLIPGHGGFLDRFDSIFYTTPILYSYWFLIVHDFKTFRIMSA
jgi:phosphatidate cytidylyltransferase